MNKALISEDNLTNIADALRAKLQTQDTFSAAEMAAAVTSIPSAHGPKTITANGVYNAVDDSLDGYNSVDVQVPMPTYNSGTLTATQNGTYNASDNGYDGFSQVNVEVPAPVTGALSVTTNGDYNAASAGYDGFNDVHVAVPIPTYNSTTLAVTSNGVYNAVTAGYDGYSEVNVQVPSGGSNLGTKDIIFNGLYNANDYGYDGFSQVNVQVPAGVEVPPLVVNNSSADEPCYFTTSLIRWFNYPVTIPEGVVDVSNMFMDYINFNQPIIMPDSVTNCKWMLVGCENFNQSVTLSNNLIDGYGIFQYCPNFNQPITLPNSIINAGTMFFECPNFNQQVNIPKNTKSIYCMFYHCTNYRPTSFEIPYNIENASRLFESTGADFDVKNVYIHKNTGTLNVCNMLKAAGRNASVGKRVNVYCNNLSMINGAATGQANSLYNGAVTWTAMENGYYNDATKINLYLYNNIFYETNASLYAKYQGNSTFDAVIRMSDDVTNCAQMLNFCPNFNSSVKIGNNVTDAGALLRNCYNFDQPITIPNGVINCRTLLQETNFNHPLVVPDSVVNCKWLLSGDCNFNSLLTLGNSVSDCSYMLQGWGQDSQPAGIFNQPLIIPESAGNCRSMLVAQPLFNQPIIIPNNVFDIREMFRLCYNMKSDIVLGTNCMANCSNFLRNSGYEGNIYAYDNLMTANMFYGKTNDTGRINYHVVGGSDDTVGLVEMLPAYLTNRTETWVYDSTNDILGSDTANIYFYFNWNGSIPGYSYLNYYSKDGLTMLHSEGYWDGFNGRWSYGSDDWSDEPNGSPVAGIKDNITENTDIYYAGEDISYEALHIYTKSTGGSDAAMYITHGAWDGEEFTADSEPVSLAYGSASAGVSYNGLVSIKYPYSSLKWGATALKNITDGTNNYSSGDLIREWSYSAQQDFYVWERE